MVPHGKSWLYGEIDSRGMFSGRNNAFIYPDFETVLLGRFKYDKMMEAYESSVIGHVFVKDMLTLEFDQPAGTVYRYWPSSCNYMRCPRLQEDPYERKTVYSGPSGTEGAGDGVFLQRDVSAGTTIAFYNGIRVMPGEIPPFESTGYQIYLEWTPIAARV